jgi:hypothetical protein
MPTACELNCFRAMLACSALAAKRSSGGVGWKSASARSAAEIRALSEKMEIMSLQEYERQQSLVAGDRHRVAAALIR